MFAIFNTAYRWTAELFATGCIYKKTQTLSKVKGKTKKFLLFLLNTSFFTAAGINSESIIVILKGMLDLLLPGVGQFWLLKIRQRPNLRFGVVSSHEGDFNILLLCGALLVLLTGPGHGIRQTLVLPLSVILGNNLSYLSREVWTASSRVMWYHVSRVSPQGASTIYLALHPQDTSPVGILHPTDKTFPWCHGAYSLLGNLHMLCHLNQFLEVAWCHLPSLEPSKKRDSFQAGQRWSPLSSKLFIYIYFLRTQNLSIQIPRAIYTWCALFSY